MKYKGTYVRWSFKREQWRYRNHKLVIFEESEEPPEDQDPPESEDEQAEVSQLLESTVQTVSALVTRLSRPQTPQMPQTPCTTQVLPGEFPSTPGPSSQVSVLPTPAATVIATPARPPVSQTLPVNPAPPVQAPVPVAPPAPRVLHHSSVMFQAHIFLLSPYLSFRHLPTLPSTSYQFPLRHKPLPLCLISMYITHY